VSGADAAAGAALSAAREDRDSVVELTRQLVRFPSRAGTDPYGPVLECMSAWLDRHGLRPRQLPTAGGETVAMVGEITGGRPGPRYVLDACLDTAPFGDEAAWTYPPTSGAIDGGWLHGRGACDSKAGAAIFAHIAARLLPVVTSWRAAWSCCSTSTSTPGISAAPGPTSAAPARRTVSMGS